MKKNQPKIILVLSAIMVAAIFRLIPHWPNFTPMAAIALAGGALVTNRFLGFVLPLAAMFISDLLTVVLINYQWTTPAEYFTSPETGLVYLSIVAMTALGAWFGSRNYSKSTTENSGKFFERKFSTDLLNVSFLSALVFFLISNFGTWISAHSLMPKTFAGLLATYELGIPFFGYNLLGNVFYSFLMFGFFHAVTDFKTSLKRETIQ
jgi:hypothetical protein